jgi:hypothetical protein
VGILLMKTRKKSEVNVSRDIYAQLANATSVKDIEDFVNDMLNVVNFPTMPKEKWSWFAGKIQQKDPTLARFLQYADKRVNEEFAIETSAQALNFGMEQGELEKAILAWEPKLENIQEWLNATKKADNWADLKKIWDALWMSKEQTSPYEQPPTKPEFKEFIDLGDEDEAPLELGAKKAQNVDPVSDKIDFIKRHINLEDMLKDLTKRYDPKSIDSLLDEVIQTRGLAEKYRLEKERIPEGKLNEIMDMSAKKKAQQDSLVDVISNDPSEIYNFLFERAEEMVEEKGQINKKELAEGFFGEVYYLYENYSKDQILEACWELADMFEDELVKEET